MLDADAQLKALADDTRRSILTNLLDGPQTAGQIANSLNTAPSALSFHLRILKSAELVSHRRNGQFIEYRLNSDAIDDLIQYLVDRFASHDFRLPPNRPAFDPMEID